MTLQQIQNNGFLIKSWHIATVKGERKIAVRLTKWSKRHKYNYVTSCVCSSALLKDAHFIDPILIDNIARV